MLSFFCIKSLQLSSVDSSEIHNRYIISSGDLQFSHCLFHDIHEKENRGGAIFSTSSSSRIFLFDVSFSQCTSSGHGGAIYIDVHSLNSTNTCFMNCYTPDDYGQAIYAELQTDGMGKFFQNSIISCPGSDNTGNSAPLALYYGSFDFDDSNNSLNYIESTYSAIYFENPKYCEASYCGILNNTGDVTFGESGIDKSVKYDHLNFIENKMKTQESSEYGLFFIDSTEGGSLSKCVFIGNAQVLIHSPTSTHITIAISGCDFDIGQSQLIYDHSKVTINFDKNCEFGKARPTNPIERFDSRFCWMINAPKLAASSATYAFILFFLIFSGGIGFTIFHQFKVLNGTEAPKGSDYDVIK